MKYFLRLIILFLFMICSNATNAAENISTQEAKNWAQSKGEQILEILAEKDLPKKFGELDKILYEDIDLDHAARFSVGKYWRTMTEPQKETYVPLFKRYMSGIYKTYPLDIKKGDIGFNVGKIMPTKKGVDVNCTINLAMLKTADGEEKNQDGFPVIFALVKNNGHIQVQDLKIGESSLLLAFRDRFIKMIHNDSDDEIDWFLEDLTTIVQDTEEENQLKLEKYEF